jgi:hypothetical protein
VCAKPAASEAARWNGSLDEDGGKEHFPDGNERATEIRCGGETVLLVAFTRLVIIQ